MTLDTAKRIVREQGEVACKEALAIVRGGMTICEKNVDGSRKYIWVKIMPTKTDEESSIDVALENRRKRKTASNKKKQPRKDLVAIPVENIETAPVMIPKEESPTEETTLSIYSLISKGKQKLRDFMKILDEIVVE